MTPSVGARCTGTRPVVPYAHGTTTDKNYNLANLSDNTNAAQEGLSNLRLGVLPP